MNVSPKFVGRDSKPENNLCFVLLPLLLVESNCHRYLDRAVEHIPSSNLAPSPVSFEWLSQSAQSLDRYERYTMAILFPGLGYTRQYALMMGGLALNFGAMFGFLRWPDLAIVLATVGELIFALGLAWHVKTTA